MPRPDITEENPIREAIAADRPGIVSMLESIQRLKRGLIGDKLSEEELDRRLDVLAMAKVRDGD